MADYTNDSTKDENLADKSGLDDLLAKEVSLEEVASGQTDIHSLNNMISQIDTEMIESFGDSSADEPVTITDLQHQAPAVSKTSVEREIDTQQYVIFSLGNSKYAIYIDHVLQIGDVPKITPIPNVPHWLKGVTNIRGDIMSVIDFSTYVGTDVATTIEHSKMLVIGLGKDDINTAVIVDKIDRILSIAKSSILTPTAAIENKMAPYLNGIFQQEKDLIMILDIKKLLHSSDLGQFN